MLSCMQGTPDAAKKMITELLSRAVYSTVPGPTNTKHTSFKGDTLVSRGLSKGVRDAVKGETNSFEELCF